MGDLADALVSGGMEISCPLTREFVEQVRKGERSIEELRKALSEVRLGGCL